MRLKKDIAPARCACTTAHGRNFEEPLASMVRFLAVGDGHNGFREAAKTRGVVCPHRTGSAPRRAYTAVYSAPRGVCSASR
jgi:hypothetical protein